MNKSAKQEILDELRGATRKSDEFTADYSVIHEKEWTQAQKIERFCQIISAVNAEIIQTTLADAQRDLIEMLTAKGVRHLMQGSPSPIAKEITDNWTATEGRTVQCRCQPDHNHGGDCGHGQSCLMADARRTASVIACAAHPCRACS